MPEDAAISGLDDASQARVRLLQSGRAVHAPILGIGLQPLIGDTFTVTSTDAGAGQGPTIRLFRDSDSSAAADVLGLLDFVARDSGGNETTVARLIAQWVDPTDGSEDATLFIRNIVAGTLTTQISLTATGLQIPAIGATTAGTGRFTTLTSTGAASLNSLTVGADLVTPIGAVGSVVDSVTATYATNANLTTVIPDDDTIPTSTEGDQILSVSITPKTTTNKLRCRFSGFGAPAASSYNMIAAMFQGTTCIDVSAISPTIANHRMNFAMEAEYTPGVTSSQTISVRVGPGAAGTVRMNGNTAGRFFGGAANATLIVEEIKA